MQTPKKFSSFSDQVSRISDEKGIKIKDREYAEFQNMEIVNEYSDADKSGKSVEGRPEFQRMLDDIENGKDEVQFVLVFKLSRFGRNAADVLNSLQRMKRKLFV